MTEAQIAAVPDVRSTGLEADLRAMLMPLRERVLSALRDHPVGGLRRDRLIDAGLTIDNAREARSLEWKAKATIPDGLPWNALCSEVAKVAEASRHVSRFAKLWHCIEDTIVEGGPEASGRAVVIEKEVGDATVRTVRLSGVERIAADWRRTPTLHIDATVNMRLLRCRVPDAELVGRVDAAAPHMRVVQYPDRAFGKLALSNQRTLLRVWDWCVAYAAPRGGEWGVIVPKESEAAIRAARTVPSFVRLHHFGKLRGLDELRDVRGLIVVGRPAAWPRDVERIAAALSGHPVETVDDDWYPASWCNSGRATAAWRRSRPTGIPIGSPRPCAGRSPRERLCRRLAARVV